MRRLALIALTVICLPAPYARSDADGVMIETLLSGLANPCGITVRPGETADRYEILIADSGTGRVIRIWSDEPNTATGLISGFTTATPATERSPVGPTALLFLDRTHLVVGVSNSEGAAVQIFELTDQLAPLAADQAKRLVPLTADGHNSSHVHAVARTRANDAITDDLLLTCFGDGVGKVSKIPLVAGTLTELERFAGSHDVLKKDSPLALAVGEGGYVVVGWVGGPDVPQDSRLVFYNPKNGARLMELPTNLYDVVALAYSPKTGNLYAADVAWMKPEHGGVFRIDDASEPGNAKCTAVRIAEVPRPSALAFGPDGALYVTAWGDISGAAPQGVLLRIAGDL